MPTEEERVPPPMGRIQAAEFVRRRRGRNVALLVVLVALVVLFYAITLVKMTKSG